MGIWDIFRLICNLAIALIMFIAVCLGICFLFGSFLHWRFNRSIQSERNRIESNREWLFSLDRLHLLMLTTEENTGLDEQDKEDLVQIAGNVYGDHAKSIIVKRLAKHLSQQFNLPIRAENEP